MYKILLIDDENEILQDGSHIICELGYECFTAEDGLAAIKILKKENLDVVLTDIKMPFHNGFDILKTMQEIDSNIPVIFITGYGSVQSAVQAMKSGAYDYIQKPFSPDILEVILKKAIDYRILRQENIALKTQIKGSFQLDNVVGKSRIMQEVADRVCKVARSDSSVLIYGESGTGKELIARSIHLHSHRSDKPFIPLDCVALPATLLESELFGFEEGAFTGAVRSKPGMLEIANTGTLFLDEIVELELNLQAKLLRTLQERQFRRIGGTKTIHVDIRILSATNTDPEKAVQSKKLRSDLFYRLNVVSIYLPPLRERKTDIPLLVQHFINKINPSCPIEIKGISQEALSILKKYNWPGNVRELQNVIEHAMSLAEQPIIGVNDLPNKIRENSLELIDDTFQEMTFKEAKEKYIYQFQRQYINSLLNKYHGNIAEVARKAGMSRKTIYRILGHS